MIKDESYYESRSDLYRFIIYKVSEVLDLDISKLSHADIEDGCNLIMAKYKSSELNINTNREEVISFFKEEFSSFLQERL